MNPMSLAAGSLFTAISASSALLPHVAEGKSLAAQLAADAGAGEFETADEVAAAGEADAAEEPNSAGEADVPGEADAAEGGAAGEQIGTEAAGEAEAGDLETLLAEGEGLYLTNCRMCHGTRGTAGVPLAANDRVYPEWVASIMIRGPGYMPSFEALSDEEIATIATFVANSWGNDFGAVTPEDVAAFR